MTLFKHTEPPKEKGMYLCEMPYDGSDIMTMVLARWMGDRWDAPNIKHYYSKVPPKEIEDLLNDIEEWLGHITPDNHIQSYHLSQEEMLILLKLRAE